MRDEVKQDLKKWVAFLADFSYKPNFEFKIDSGLDFGVPMIEMIMWAPDSRSEMNERPLIRIVQKLALPPWLWGNGEAAAIDWMHRSIRKMEVLETDEWFRFKGELVFDPHKEKWA